MRISLTTLKRGVLFFWALWLSIVLLTNVTDLLKQLGVLAPEWSFASGNYGFMQATTSVHQLPEAAVLVLFLGVIVWEGLAAFLLWRAFAAYRRHTASALASVNSAFAVSLALWAAFVVADELFIAYDVETTHTGIFTAQVVTLLGIHLLRDESV